MTCLGPLPQRPGHAATHQSYVLLSPYDPAAHCKERGSHLHHFTRPLPTSLPLAVSLDLCFTGPFKHPHCHHHTPLVQFSALQAADERTTERLLRCSGSFVWAVRGDRCFLRTPTPLSSQGLDICVFPPPRDGRQAWEPGQPALLESPALASSAQQRPLRCRSCSAVTSRGISSCSDHNNTCTVDFPCSDSARLSIAWGRILGYFKCPNQLLHWIWSKN